MQSDIRRRIDANLAILEKARNELKSVQKDKADAMQRVAIYESATGLLKDLYEQTQERYQGQIMDLVSYCLQMVFGDEAYRFRIRYEQKRNQVEACFRFVRGDEEYDPLTAVGGGVLSVACFALRLAVLYMLRGRRIMIQDEPFSQLSEQYRGAMRALLEDLADKFGFQFIIVTHCSELEMGVCHNIG